MGNYLAVGLSILVGGFISVQSAINSELGKQIGGLAAALVSFSVGTIALALFYIFSSESGLRGVFKVSPYLLIGGFLGAMFVFSMIKVLPNIGAGAAIAGVIAGQLLLAMLVDHFGWFGVTKIAVSWQRGIGAVLLLVAVKLIGK